MWSDSTRAGTGRTPSLWFEPLARKFEISMLVTRGTSAPHPFFILTPSFY